MKTLCSLCVLLLSFAAASAQQYQAVQLLLGGTANITGGSTSNYTASVNVRGADNVAIYTSHKLNGAGTDGIIFKFSKSADGSNFETTPSILFTNTAAGTGAVLTITPVSVVGCHSIRLASIVNGVSGQAVTNLFVTVGVKNIFR